MNAVNMPAFKLRMICSSRVTVWEHGLQRGSKVSHLFAGAGRARQEHGANFEVGFLGWKL
jgi:hypothetical protein